jgi:SAM-dependent methyltransferase
MTDFLSEPHPTQELYQKALAEAAAMDAAQADYFALNQGEYGTHLRHTAVLDCVEGLDGNVLDLGCGTGLFLDKMIEQGIRPKYYLGMDGMPERHDPVSERLARHGVQGRFQEKPWNARFEDVMMPYVDAVLFVGMMGYWGYHSQRHVVSIHNKLKRVSKHGCVTFPMIYDPNSMGDSYLRRWEVNDVKDLLQLGTDNIKIIEREFVIYW